VSGSLKNEGDRWVDEERRLNTEWLVHAVGWKKKKKM
jgi:hypothetical protein